MTDAAILFARSFAGARFEDLPVDVVEITKQEILDTLGVAVAGFGQPGPSQLTELVRAWNGCAQSSLIGSRLKAPAPDAAQVNATMAHARDYDDVHESAVMHPAVVTVIPALATAELVGKVNGRGPVSGRDLITSVALGADMICRLGLATRPGVSPIQTGWHFTTLYGYPTTALTTGRLLGLDEERLIHAFGIAYHQCSGNGQCVVDGALTKRLGPGFAVRGGMIAALLAQADVTGARNSLEGENGLFKVYQRGEYDRDVLTRDLGHAFEGSNVSLKPYPCCRGVHASIDAALELRKRHAIDPHHIREIVVTTGAANHHLLCTPSEAKLRPRNPVDAQFSIPWGVATALLRGRVVMDDFTTSAVADREALALTAKMRTEVDPTLNSSRGVEPARVKLVMDDGKSWAVQVDLARGSPGKRLSFDDCAHKFHDCVSFAGGWMTQANAGQAVEIVMNLENVEDVRELIELFA
ncbi:MAG: MmgE/PrpD family protein [Burkholderiaceae bacterium]|nr:MmgE/PrpD family protein [Burkholderiaceae bacterium]